MRPLQLFGALLLAVLFGFAAGTGTAQLQSAGSLPLTVQAWSGSTVGMVRIDKILNGVVQGNITGGTRFLLGDTLVTPDDDGSFRVDAAKLLTNLIEIRVPEGMRFVASARGSKYYPVDSAGGSRITPKNRVYFRTAEEAEKAGYKK